MRIDSSGNLLVGTTSAISGYLFRVNGQGAFAGPSSDVDGNGGVRIDYGNSSGTVLRFLALNANGSTNAAIGLNMVDSSNGSMVFSTRGSNSLGERMRIDSSGNLLVGTTTQLGSARATFKAGSALPAISIGMANSAGTYAAQIFFNGDNIDSGSIDVNNAANTTAYTTSSDYRLKINVQPIVNALDKVSQLNPVTWNWKKNPSLDSSGFIAHELQAVCPDAVTGYKDEVDAEGKPVYQGVDTSFLVATLTAAIQELKAEFDAYKATHP
jgi:hypothetical protein